MNKIELSGSQFLAVAEVLGTFAFAASGRQRLYRIAMTYSGFLFWHLQLQLAEEQFETCWLEMYQ